MVADKIHILSTSVLAEELFKEKLPDHFELDIIPFIKTEKRLTPEIKAMIRKAAREERTVVFTSKQAVKAILSVLENVPPWQIYCISGETRKTVLTFWKKESIKGMAGNGAALAEKIRESCLQQEKPVLFFSGNQRLQTIPEQLAGYGIPLQEVVVYNTITTPSRINRSYDGILFFSPSGVHSFFSENSLAHAVLFSIGDTTANALRSYVPADVPVLIAGQPDKKELLKMAIHYFEKKTNE